MRLKVKQLKLDLRRWGGRRRGAGRKPNGAKAGVSHLRRAPLGSRYPVHVTVRVREGTWGLRRGRSFAALRRSFAKARENLGMRLCEFSVMGNHIHFLVEAKDAQALARGMQGLGVRTARALNRVMKKHGAVYADRYHSRILRTPTEVARALNYVLTNAKKHGLIRRGIDPCSSENRAVAAACTAAAHTWLLTRGFRRAAPS